MAKAITIDYKQLNKDVLDARDRVKSLMTIDKDSGVITVEPTSFETTLPEGVTPEMVNKVDKARGDFIAGVACVIGDLGMDALEENKALAAVSTAFKAGDDFTVTTKLDRTTSGLIPRKPDAPADAPQETYTKHGVLSVKVRYDGGSADKGQLGKVKKAIGNAAAEAFAG